MQFTEVGRENSGVPCSDNRLTTDPRIVALEAEYQRLGGTGLNRKHNVVLFTTGNLYEHMSGKELSARWEG